METTSNDTNQLDARESRLLALVVERFGSRTHLQPKEIAELVGLKTKRPINDAITSGALVATRWPGCDRLRFVELDDFLSFMRSNQIDRPKPRTARRAGVREQRALARVGREGRALASATGARSLS
jgi:hypothetical protein